MRKNGLLAASPLHEPIAEWHSSYEPTGSVLNRIRLSSIRSRVGAVCGKPLPAQEHFPGTPSSQSATPCQSTRKYQPPSVIGPACEAGKSLASNGCKFSSATT